MIGILEQQGKNLVENPIPLRNIVAEYKYENNVLDTVGLNNGTPNNVNYVSGLIGLSADFDGLTSYFTVPSSEDLSFTDSVNDKPFSLTFNARWETKNVNSNWLFNKRGAGYNMEYQITYDNTSLFVKFFDDALGGNITVSSVFNPVLGDTYLIYITYDGSGLASGVNIIVNGVYLPITDTSVAPYNCMIAANEQLVVSARAWELPSVTSSLNGQIGDTHIWNIELNEEQIKEIYDKQSLGIDINPTTI